MTRIASPVLVLVLVLALAGCGPEPRAEIAPAEQGAGQGAPPARAPEGTVTHSAAVRWVAVRAASDRSLLEAPARAVAAPGASARVAPPFAARIVSIEVAPGDSVHEGDVLAHVSMPEVLDAAAIWVGGARRLSLRERRRAELEALRSEGLVEAGRVFEQDTSVADLGAERSRALAILRAAGVPSSRAASVLSRGTIAITAPIDGVVAAVGVRLGEVRDPSGEPLVELIGSAPVRIEARLSSPLPDGAVLTFVAADGTRTPLRATPDASAIDPADGTRRVWISPSEPVAMADGLRGTLDVRVEGEGVFEVPANAIGRDAQGTFVVRQTSDGHERVAIEVLASGGGSAIARGPLAAGDSVAADAALLLRAPDPGDSE